MNLVQNAVIAISDYLVKCLIMFEEENKHTYLLLLNQRTLWKVQNQSVLCCEYTHIHVTDPIVERLNIKCVVL